MFSQQGLVVFGSLDQTLYRCIQMGSRVDTTTELWQQILQGVRDQVAHSQRPYAKERVGLYWDTIRDYKDSQEKDVCECFARSLLDQGMGNIREIRKYHHPENSDKDFPDCLASMDGKEIGIEVVQLRKDLDPCDGQIRYKEWTSKQFREEVLKIVQSKDEKAQILGREELLKFLDQLYVVIFTDEFTLSPEKIRNYLRQPLGPKPCKIDEVYVLGPYEPANNTSIRGREDEPMEPRVEHTAFRIRWEGENQN